MSNLESNQDEALTMIGFGNGSNDFANLMNKKGEINIDSEGKYMR